MDLSELDCSYGNNLNAMSDEFIKKINIIDHIKWEKSKQI